MLQLSLWMVKQIGSRLACRLAICKPAAYGVAILLPILCKISPFYLECQMNTPLSALSTAHWPNFGSVAFSWGKQFLFQGFQSVACCR